MEQGFMSNDEIRKASEELSLQIKKSVDTGLELGELSKEEDFYINETGDEMIEIEDQFGNTIFFNYTKSQIQDIKKE